jgi:hypothetical protein
MSAAVLTPPGPRQMAAADELLDHRRDLLADVDDQALNDWCRGHLGVQVTVHTGCSPQKQSIHRYERARGRCLDAGLQHRLSVLCPPLTMSGCSVAGALIGAPGTTARDRMTMQETVGIFFQDQNWLEAGYCIRMLLALVIDAGPCGACKDRCLTDAPSVPSDPRGNCRILKNRKSAAFLYQCRH